MAEQSFPQIPSAVWWKVRNAFKKTVPARLTDTYLASILNVKPNAARIYLRDFQSTGLLNEKSEPTDLAYAWRDDEKYSEATEKMLNAIYPDELRASAPAPDPDRQQVARWFMHERKLGQGAANNKAAFYFLLASGELQKSVPAEKREQKHKKTETASSLEPRKTNSRSICRLATAHSDRAKHSTEHPNSHKRGCDQRAN
jgi:hypothetical protein